MLGGETPSFYVSVNLICASTISMYANFYLYLDKVFNGSTIFQAGILLFLCQSLNWDHLGSNPMTRFRHFFVFVAACSIGFSTGKLKVAFHGLK